MKLLLALTLILGNVAFAEYENTEDNDGTISFRLLGHEWYPSAFSLASLETDKAEKGGRLSTYNYLTYSTYMSGFLSDYRFKVRLPFTYGVAGTDRFNGDKLNKSEFLVQDVILEMSNGQFMYLPKDVGVYWAGRLYLPTSKISRDSDMVARYRNQFIFSKAFAPRWEVSYDQRLNYYWQSRKAYRRSFQDSDGFDVVDAISLTKKFEFQHSLNLWRMIGLEGGVGWRMSWEDTYWNTSKENGTRTGERKKSPEHLMSMGPQFRFPVADAVDMIFGYQDNADVEVNYNEFGRFLAKNTEFVLNTFISF